jgi:heterodisulfide reductase subunit C/nitrate reductase gamma subunit
MIFDILFYSSLSICIFGTFFKIYSWTKRSVGYQKDISSHRFAGLIKSVISTIFSFKIIDLTQSFFMDILFQKKILKVSFLRWVMHFLIFAGFLALLLMHAMDELITENLFSYYYSTINPFFFLRSLFGLMVLTGITIAVYRRYYLKPARLKNASADLFAIIIICAIILSGILLEGMKMASVSEFSLMVEDYAGLDYEDEETIALETYWVKEFALVSSRTKRPFDTDVLDLGFEIHEESCEDCHSPNKTAFLGYAAAKLISPFAVFMDRINGVSIFYYAHILACFLGLALLPFSKMFHVFATPISLMTNAVRTNNRIGYGNLQENINHQANKNQLTRELMELDACTHCSTCNLNCSAGMMYESVKNDYVLPSEKIQFLKKASGKSQLSVDEFKAIFQGLYLCTNCDRCTVVCPSGIDLKSLWLSVRENFIQQDQDRSLMLSTFSFVRGLNHMNLENESLQRPLTKTFEKIMPGLDKTGPLTINPQTKGSQSIIDLPLVDTFSHCFGCQNCSTCCPVVTSFPNPEDELGLLPHQIMYSLGLGLVNMAKGSAMIWNCLSCYQCQENCPQNVTVCDILFQLKNKVSLNFTDKDL